MKASPGREFVYARGKTLILPSDLELPTCEVCGADYLSAEQEKEILAAIPNAASRGPLLS